MDNIFVADAYDEPLQNNLTISAYSAYSAGTKSHTGLLLMGVG
jgi:hypothetical protein